MRIFVVYYYLKGRAGRVLFEIVQAPDVMTARKVFGKKFYNVPCHILRIESHK